MTASHEQTEDSRDISRRQFMDHSIKLIGAFFTLTLGVPAVGYLISPAIQQQAGKWVRLARSSQVETGVPTLFTVTIDKTTGWVRSEVASSYFVYTENGEDFKVMSNICPHVGCQTNWNAADGFIHCPCHDGRFDVQGNVIAGPSPRSLDQVVFRVDETGNILIES